VLRKKLAVLLTVALMALMICTVAGVASAQGGCAAFGQSVATDAKAPGPLGQQFVRGHAPLNDEVAAEQGQFCG
jgi:hypothetical protein